MTEQDILRVVDSCGGADQPDESTDWSRGYNEALDAVERELKRHFAATRKHDPSALVEALRAIIPNNVCNNPNVPDDLNFPCDITMGELRQAWAALAEASQ